MQKEKTDLRERTKTFALRVVRMFSALPKTTEAQVLGKQLLRSGTSIGANYREAFRARSKAEFIAKCGDSLREIEESAYWLELLFKKLATLRTDAPLFKKVETLRWRGPTPEFAKWAERMEAPQLPERCDRVILRHAVL